MTINIEELLKQRLSLTFQIRQFLIISVLHHNKLISGEKLNGMFKIIYKQPNRFYRNYNCNINNKWYNNLYRYDILLDVYNELNPVNKMMEFSELQPYVEKFNRRGWNKSLEHVNNVIITPYFNAILNINNNDEELNKILKSFNIPVTSKLDTINYDAHYCCEKCDGNKTKYINDRKQIYVDRLHKEIDKYYYKEIRNLWKRKKRSLKGIM